MRTLRVATVIALVGIGVVIGYFSAQSSVSAASDGLAAQDYADIQQLYWRYNHGTNGTKRNSWTCSRSITTTPGAWNTCMLLL